MNKPNSKKIFKFILFTKAEIFSLNCLKNNLVFTDKEGFLNLVGVSKKSKCLEIYVNILKKLKISNSSILIKGVFGHYFVFIELKKQNLILNLSKDLVIPKKCSFFECLENLFWILQYREEILLMVKNENLQFFIYNTTIVEKKTEILLKIYPFKIKNLGKNNLFLERLKIQQCIVKPGKFFILFGFDKFLEFIDCDKISLKQIKNKVLFQVKNFPFCVDSIGRQVIIMNGKKVVKIIFFKPNQRNLNINFKLPRKKEKINKKKVFL